MRFSILVLDLPAVSGADRRRQSQSITRFMAEHNVSCACLRGCTQSSKAPLIEDGRTIRVGNIGAEIAGELNGLGIKYECVWESCASAGDDVEEGPALLSQLPVLGTAGTDITMAVNQERAETRRLVALRLGVSPDINVDLFSVDLTGRGADLVHQAKQLVQFVGQSALDLEPEPQPAPRRRGRPPRRVEQKKRPDPVRMVFLGGGFGNDAGAHDVLRSAGFALGSATDYSQSNGRIEPAVYLRPGLRATDVDRRADMAEDEPDSGELWSGVCLGFEI